MRRQVLYPSPSKCCYHHILFYCKLELSDQESDAFISVLKCFSAVSLLKNRLTTFWDISLTMFLFQDTHGCTHEHDRNIILSGALRGLKDTVCTVYCVYNGLIDTDLAMFDPVIQCSSVFCYLLFYGDQAVLDEVPADVNIGCIQPIVIDRDCVFLHHTTPSYWSPHLG